MTGAEPPEEKGNDETRRRGEPSTSPLRKLGRVEGLSVTDTELKWEQRAEQAYLEALPAVRSAAEKWAGLTGVVLGVFGLRRVHQRPG
jgi:hypothetical protein